MQPALSYIPYATSHYEQTGNIITFAQFQQGNLVENERNTEKEETISDSIDELSTYNDSDRVSISTNTLKDIQNVSQILPEINTRGSRSKICYPIEQTQNECKGKEILEKRRIKVLHKVFKAIVNELNNKLTYLGKSGSEVSHFIPEPRNFVEVTILSEDLKKAWLKATLKQIKILINNQTFLMNYSEKGDPVTPCMDAYKSKIQSDGSLEN